MTHSRPSKLIKAHKHADILRVRNISKITSNSEFFVTTTFNKYEGVWLRSMPRLCLKPAPVKSKTRQQALDDLATALDEHFLGSQFVHGDLNRKNIRWHINGYVVLDFEPSLIDPESLELRCTYPYIHLDDFSSGILSTKTDLLGWHYFILSQMQIPYKRPKNIETANSEFVRLSCSKGSFKTVLNLTLASLKQRTTYEV